MSKDNHTPGPWAVTDYLKDTRVVSVDGYGSTRGFVCLCGQGEEHEANARLIAAAPEMLEALKECNRYFCDQGGHVFNYLGDLISKATGQDSDH